MSTVCWDLKFKSHYFALSLCGIVGLPLSVLKPSPYMLLRSCFPGNGSSNRDDSNLHALSPNTNVTRISRKKNVHFNDQMNPNHGLNFAFPSIRKTATQLQTARCGTMHFSTLTPPSPLLFTWWRHSDFVIVSVHTYPNPSTAKRAHRLIACTALANKSFIYNPDSFPRKTRGKLELFVRRALLNSIDSD